MEAISGIDLSANQSASLLMRDLSECATLPFLAAFDVRSAPPLPSSSNASKSAPKRVTYIAVIKKIMPMLVELFLQFKDQVDIYVDGTVEAVLSVCLVAIRIMTWA